MVTPELANFVRIELERNVSEVDITSKLISAGWLAADVAEALTQNKIPTTVNVAKVSQNTESAKVSSTQVKGFDPYRESPVDMPQTNFAYKVPKTDTSSDPAPLMPDLIPKSIGYMQNQVGSVQAPTIKPEPAIAPALSEYQNKLEKIVIAPPVISPVMMAPTVPKKSSHVIRTILFIVFTLLIIGGLFYSYTKGYIKMPFDVPFLKKDPHQVLSEVPSAMTKVKTFKSDTEIKVTFPAVSSIIGMVMGGEAKTTANTDYVNLNTNISFDNTDMNNRKIDATLTGASSLVEQAISLNLRTIGDTSYAKVSDIQKLVPKEITIPLDWVSVNKNDLDSMYAKANKDNKILPNEGNKNALENFLSSFDLKSLLSKFPLDANTIIKENPSVLIGSVDTYHYSITVDSVATNKIIHSLATTYGFNFTESDWVEVDKILSAAQVNTFDVWVGKKDMLLYKIDVVILLPLNKVLSLEDKNLAENTLKFEFINNYHDYNSPLSITAPDNTTSILQVVDMMDKANKDTDMKDTIGALTNSFGKMYDLEKIYGYKSNLGGSCANPTYGSLYSPTGHKKSAGDVVSSIAKNMISLMSMSGDKALCYSTPYAWAISAPLYSDSTKYYCADNSGAFIESTLPLDGVKCK